MKPRMMLNFPEELVIEILERLPAKSLMRFKCVQRSWDSLFKTNSFIINQSKNKNQSSVSNERFIIFRLDNISGSILLFSYSEPIPVYQLSDAQNPFPSNYHYCNMYFDLWGHCNGVFCLSYYSKNEKTTIMWNPATRDVNHLPPSPSPYGDDNKYSTYAGFGIDPNTFFYDFKFIRFYSKILHTDDNDDSTALLVSAEIYSSSTNSWTILHDLDIDVFLNPDTPLALYGFFTSAFANGVYHWLSVDKSYILCFDFCLNQFRKVYTPKVEEDPQRAYIVEVHDSIAFALDFHIRAEIWILKQDNNWTKLCKIEPFNPFLCVAIPNWINDAKFIGRSWEGSLVSYNFRGQTPHQVEILPPGEYFCMHEYLESIAPCQSSWDTRKKSDHASV